MARRTLTPAEFARGSWARQARPPLSNVPGPQAGAWYASPPGPAADRSVSAAMNTQRLSSSAPPSVAQSTSASPSWRLVSGFYGRPWRVRGARPGRVCLSGRHGRRRRRDDRAGRRGGTPASAADIVLETEATRLRLSPSGMVHEFPLQASGEGLRGRRGAAAGAFGHRVRAWPRPCTMSRATATCSCPIPRPEVKATLRVSSRPRHLLVEVVNVEPSETSSSSSLRFPFAG